MLDEVALPAAPDAGQHDPARGAAGAGGAGRPVLRARGRGRHRARGQDAGRRLRRRRRGAVTGCAWLGAARRHGVRRRRSPWSTASPRSPTAATRWSPAWRSTSSRPGSGRPWPTPGSARRAGSPVTARARPLRPDRPAARRRASRPIPVLGPIYAELISGHNVLVYLTAAAGAAGRLGGLPHPLRPAPARRGREPGRGRHGRHLGRRHALPGADGHRRAVRHRRRLPVDRAERRLHPRHDRGQGLPGARRPDLRQVAAGAGPARLPAVRLHRRAAGPAPGRAAAGDRRRCRSS